MFERLEDGVADRAQPDMPKSSFCKTLKGTGSSGFTFWARPTPQLHWVSELHDKVR